VVGSNIIAKMPNDAVAENTRPHKGNSTQSASDD